MSNSQGSVVWRANYSPFGFAAIVTGSTLTFNLRFPGQYFDSETGLHYNYTRYYDPALGRHIQSDRIGLSGGLNTYGYSRQNPLKYVDPDGTNPFQQTMSNFREARTFDLGRDPVELVSGVLDPYTEEEKSCVQQCIARETLNCITPSRPDLRRGDLRLAAACTAIVVLTCTPDNCDEDECSE